MAKTYAPKLTTTRGRSVQLSDIEMYYEEYGAGTPLLLLHGFGGCSQNWHAFTTELSSHYRVIVVDLRGHGHSTNPENKFTHKEAANDVFLLLEKLGVDHFSAMGMSTGGMTLLHMATSQPGRIDSMVLISTTSHFTDQARAIMRSVSFETMPREVQEMYRECAKRGDEQIRQLVTQFKALHQNYDDMIFNAQTLSTITARTLVVHGDRDKFFPVEIAVSIYRSIPNAALWIVPNGNLHEQTEEYEHIGKVQTYSLNLDEHYKNFLSERTVFLHKEDADVVIYKDFLAPPPVMWEWSNDPKKRTLWSVGSDWKVREQPNGSSRKGASNHCVNSKVVEKILDYRPFQYYTSAMGRGPFNFILTVKFEETDAGTRLYWHVKMNGILPRFLKRLITRLIIMKGMQVPAGFERLFKLVEEEKLKTT